MHIKIDSVPRTRAGFPGMSTGLGDLGNLAPGMYEGPRYVDPDMPPEVRAAIVRSAGGKQGGGTLRFISPRLKGTTVWTPPVLVDGKFPSTEELYDWGSARGWGGKNVELLNGIYVIKPGTSLYSVGAAGGNGGAVSDPNRQAAIAWARQYGFLPQDDNSFGAVMKSFGSAIGQLVADTKYVLAATAIGVGVTAALASQGAAGGASAAAPAATAAAPVGTTAATTAAAGGGVVGTGAATGGGLVSSATAAAVKAGTALATGALTKAVTGLLPGGGGGDAPPENVPPAFAPVAAGGALNMETLKKLAPFVAAGFALFFLMPQDKGARKKRRR